MYSLALLHSRHSSWVGQVLIVRVDSTMWYSSTLSEPLGASSGTGRCQGFLNAFIGLIFGFAQSFVRPTSQSQMNGKIGEHVASKLIQPSHAITLRMLPWQANHDFFSPAWSFPLLIPGFPLRSCERAGSCMLGLVNFCSVADNTERFFKGELISWLARQALP